MIVLYETVTSKATLAHVPEDEKILYFVLGEIANEVTMLSKQLAYWLHVGERGEDEAETFARTAAGLMTTKFLAGRLYEAWNVLRDGPHSRTYKAYESELDGNAKIALTSLKKYFSSKTNIINRLRNKVAFHTDYDVVRAALSSFPDDEPIIDFIHAQAGNTFYNSAHVVLAYALEHLAEGGGIEVAIGRVADEVIELAGTMGRYVHGYLAVFAIRYIVPEPTQESLKARQISAPAFDSVRTPFFSEPPSVIPARAEREPGT